MGGRPILALNIVAWPVDDLPLEMLGRVLQGGVDVASRRASRSSGGTRSPTRNRSTAWSRSGWWTPTASSATRRAAGARLFLTKPIGLGIISTAIKRGVAEPELVAAAVEMMTTLNAAAAEAMVEAGAEAATDVTGFGLLGHLHKMLPPRAWRRRSTPARCPCSPASSTWPGGRRPGRHAAQPRVLRPAVDWGELIEPEQWSSPTRRRRAGC